VYTAGKIIYFDPFFFKTGGSKNKFFLVIKVIDNAVILASLPSSQSHLPLAQKIEHGCLEIPESCINCYIFEANRPITKTGWSFNKNTFLHGYWLDDFSIADLEIKYAIEKVDYEIIGQLTDDELANVIKCFANSSTVKRKYKRILANK
jgi:hypothetical protein